MRLETEYNCREEIGCKMLYAHVDEFTPCLKDARTGELVQTEVVRVVRKSFLQKYNKSNGWYVDWAALLAENEVYALVLKGTVDIQGLVAVENNDDVGALYVSWACISPENNKLIVEEPRYKGVGGHLFAIAAQVSIDHGYDGYLYGFAANAKLLEHYLSVFGADHIGVLHPYQIAIDASHAKQIIQEYDYEWTDGKL